MSSEPPRVVDVPTRTRAWLLARPRPVRLPRRIVSITGWLLLLALTFGLPHVPRDLAREITLVVVPLPLALLAAMFAWAAVKRHARHRERNRTAGDR